MPTQIQLKTVQTVEIEPEGAVPLVSFTSQPGVAITRLEAPVCAGRISPEAFWIHFALLLPTCPTTAAAGSWAWQPTAARPHCVIPT